MATGAGFLAPLDTKACSAKTKTDCHSEPQCCNDQDKNVLSSGAASASFRSHNPTNFAKLQTGLARPDFGWRSSNLIQNLAGEKGMRSYSGVCPSITAAIMSAVMGARRMPSRKWPVAT